MKSPEEHSTNDVVATTPSNTGTSTIDQNRKPLMWIAIGAIIAAGLISSYLIGYNIAKHRHNENITGVERRQEHTKVSLRSTKKIVYTAVRGTVESSNATSIMIKKTKDGETTSYTIASGTDIVKDGKTATVSDLTTGSSVAIRIKSDDTAAQKTAKTIIINPQTSTRRG